jgi:hypothetical protein
MRNHLKLGSLIFILASSLAAYAQDGDDSGGDGQAASSKASPLTGDRKPEGNDAGLPQYPRD